MSCASRRRVQPGRLPSLLAAARRRHRAATAEAERGTSLMELVVGMTIMTIFMGIFTGAVIMLYRSSSKADSINSSTAQLTQAFSTLDRTVRYAAAISAPGTGTGGNWYVELRTTNSGSEVCTQLRVDVATTQLQRRAWTVTGSVAGTPSAWVQLASGITNGGAAVGSADVPFFLKARSASVNYQQLGFTLIAQAGPANSRTTSRSAYAFTAINSTVPPPSGICTFSGWRP